MSNKKSDSYRIIFRTNADWSLGLGHLSRCRSLILAFSKVSSPEFTVITNNDEVTRNFLAGITVDGVDAVTEWPSNMFDLAITDLPKVNSAEAHYLRQHAKTLVCIDDTGPGLPGQDVLIRPNLSNLPRPETLSEDRAYWSGGDYIILHPAFKKYAQLTRDCAAPPNKLLVCFGGSDPGGLTLRLLPLLRQLEGELQVHLVLGAAFQGVQAVLDLIGHDPRFRVEQNLPTMAQAIWQAAGAVISGGTLLYEACALGLPALVLAQNQAQVDEAKLLEEAGAIISLGVYDRVSDEQIMAGLGRIINDRLRRQAMSKLSRGLISADGASLIASRLMAMAPPYVNESRP